MKKFIFTLTLIALPLITLAEDEQTTTDIPSQNPLPLPQSQDRIRKSNFLAQWWESIIKGNVDHTYDRAIDISVAAAPYYSQESSVGIGASVSALYRTNKLDSLMQPSSLGIMGGVSVKGTQMISIDGIHHFSRNNRLTYALEYKHQVRDLWGFNFKDCDTNPAVNNHFHRLQFSADYKQRIINNWFWGASLRLNSIKCKSDSIEYLRGQSDKGFFAGVGPLVEYDSRDYILNPKRGNYFLYRLVLYPRFMTTQSCDVSFSTLQFNTYHKIWKDCILAYDLFCEFNLSNGEVPWQLRKEINVNDCRMRGNYTGRYIDDNQICTQIELRQHVWKRLGAVAWAGVGTLFSQFKDIDKRHILPTYGGGVRFEMKANTNLRLDIGFGRDNMAFMFGFGEAF